MLPFLSVRVQVRVRVWVWVQGVVRGMTEGGTAPGAPT